MKKDPEFQTTQLKSIYALFDQIMADYQFVCREKCATCCTCNVTITSLEANLILNTLDEKQIKVIKKALVDRFPERRYIPEMTSNQFARLCVQGKEVPEEKNDPSWGKCPFIKEDLCIIYNVRPFGCRALMSQIDCKKNDIAQIPPLVLTINNIFLQSIEHMDNGGEFGNLSDMLMLHMSEKNPLDPLQLRNTIKKSGFLVNESISTWMIPIEHQQTARTIIEKINKTVEDASP